MMTMTKENDMTLADILRRAKKCSVKGRYYIYESFKRELQELNLDPVAYSEACRDLARYLEV